VAAESSPIEIVRQFMKLIEPLNYDKALKLGSGPNSRISLVTDA